MSYNTNDPDHIFNTRVWPQCFMNEAQRRGCTPSQLVRDLCRIYPQQPRRGVVPVEELSQEELIDEMVSLRTEDRLEILNRKHYKRKEMAVRCDTQWKRLKMSEPARKFAEQVLTELRNMADAREHV